jgi:hypothetical protein
MKRFKSYQRCNERGFRKGDWIWFTVGFSISWNINIITVVVAKL